MGLMFDAFGLLPVSCCDGPSMHLLFLFNCSSCGKITYSYLKLVNYLFPHCSHSITFTTVYLQGATMVSGNGLIYNFEFNITNVLFLCKLFQKRIQLKLKHFSQQILIID